MRGPAEQQIFLGQIALEVPAKRYVTLSGIFLEDFYWTEAKKGLVDWACDRCLRAGIAIQGQPARQLFCDFAPHFAYFNKAGICRDCGGKFTFPKSEQQYWYEELGFWVQAEKVRCEACQQLKKRRDRFSQLMAVNNYSDLEAIREIIAYYLQNKEFHKAKQFLAAGQRNCVENNSVFIVLNELIVSAQRLDKKM